MTQVKLEQRNKRDEQKEGKASKMSSRCISENCIQILAWVLLTVGLCIIITTFYLAIAADGSDDREVTVTLDESINQSTDTVGVTHEPTLLSFSGNGRALDTPFYGSLALNFKGCIHEDCKMVCTATSNIYTTLYNKLLGSTCQTTGVLVIDKQEFPAGLIKNNWLPLNHTVYELMITASNVTKIKSEAFNTDIFANLFLLYLRKLNEPKIESGALLGLYKLNYLTIDTKLQTLDKAFFQPVQTTLTHLTLNAGLKIGKNNKIFGLSYLSKLEYADLSYNNFVGPLSKYLFYSVPNLKYLHLSASKISAIDNDAFKYLKKLNLLNLSHNMLTKLNANVFATIFRSDWKAFVSLEPNIWHCDCSINDLAKVYKANKDQFMDILYCKSPHSRYGKFVHELNLQELGCDISSSELTTESTEFPSHEEESDELNDTRQDNITVFQMRCLNMYNNKQAVSEVQLDTANTNFESNVIDLSKDDARLEQIEARDLEYFHFEPPVYEFELVLLPNRSVKVVIDEFNETSAPINIIWFSEQTEDYRVSYEDDTIDYNCVGYELPYLLVDELKANETYTFCLIPYYEYTITPFNCLPLHVPRIWVEDDTTWISRDNKEFTVGMLCLIFTLSTFFGALIAYFGIKTYPDLLEGSKNVLVVKKSEKTCYVSTIAETDYLKQSQIKKKISDSSMKKFSLPETPNTPAPPPPLPLERLASMKSSSTCFEESFVAVNFQDDEYEMPKSFDLNEMRVERCVPNAYAASPGSPPPLPKRNSIYSEHLVMNRFNKQ